MNEATITDIDDKTVTVKVGDYVGFKSDYEQSGQIKEIKSNGRWNSGYTLVLHNPDGFGGDYLRYATETEVDSGDVWTS